jgi:hypothetical protein
MSAPVFPTKWHFLNATVLIGADEDGRILLQEDGEGGRVLPMWTDVEVATAAVPQGYSLRHTPVRDRIAELPEGVSVRIYGAPDQDSLEITSEYAVALKEVAVPFPAGTRFGPWVELPQQVSAALADAARGYAFVDTLWAFTYWVENGPVQGLVVYATPGGLEAQESIVDALGGVLDRHADDAMQGVDGVFIVSRNDLPVDVQAVLPEQQAVWTR